MCQQIWQLDVEENAKFNYVPAIENKSFFFNGTPRTFHETMASFFARMANETCEKVGKH
jgi:hypothetical protein